jgi:hypothetical protein
MPTKKARVSGQQKKVTSPNKAPKAPAKKKK